ncbi:TM2 domain-containing protein [Bifidobacterium lemurum]|uniref:TM2 domain-containing protein n=1 Tax=Bifidobacterium lemurum TaxID=1603886 RepID=A0A261FT02_9BIFI|nr:TM2 domain-containing protein [Bifidobacterium lemurum]OZG62324.1 TM2 domain-containing protein [Bifidobacterium lemurum]QOL33687.1 NINE protein [Bifidobacterium lemurum]
MTDYQQQVPQPDNEQNAGYGAQQTGYGQADSYASTQNSYAPQGGTSQPQYEQPTQGYTQPQYEQPQDYDQQQGYAQQQQPYGQQSYTQYTGQSYGQQPYTQYTGQPYGQQPYGQPYGQPYMPVYGGRSKLAAGLLGIFLGSLGVHNFYLGNTGKAVAQLLLTLVGWIVIVGPLVSGIWALVEAILILCSQPGSPWHQDANGRELAD